MRLALALPLLLGLHASALAHEPLSLQQQDRLTRASDLQALGSFSIGYAELAAQLAREPSGASPTEPSCTVSGRANPNLQTGEQTYWEHKWLNTCGGVMSPHWHAAARLALRRCQAMSLDSGVWPPATPVVRAPASFSADDHHDRYRIGDGDVTGICVFPQQDTAGD